MAADGKRRFTDCAAGAWEEGGSGEVGGKMAPAVNEFVCKL